MPHTQIRHTHRYSAHTCSSDCSATDRTTHVYRQASRGSSADRRSLLYIQREEKRARRWERKEQRLNVYSTVTYTSKNCTPICCRCWCFSCCCRCRLAEECAPYQKIIFVYNLFFKHLLRPDSPPDIKNSDSQTSSTRLVHLLWANPKNFALFQGKHMLRFSFQFDSCGFLLSPSLSLIHTYI